MQKKGWAAAMSIFVALSTLSGCGATATTQNLHSDNVDVAASLSPAPIAMMQDEGLSIQFTKGGKVSEVKNVSVEFAMPSMTMNDTVTLNEVSPGKFQGDYRFSMTGNWVEKIHYTIDNQLEIATVTWDVKQ